MSRGGNKRSDIDEILNEELEDPAFAKAWAETELEDQTKRMLIKARKEGDVIQTDQSADLSKLFGSVTGLADGMEFQRRARGEWD